MGSDVDRPDAAQATAQVEAYLKRQATKSLLRLTTCGSVDDGKSTLIGRLLYDAQGLFEDQRAGLYLDGAAAGARDPQSLDLASLVDGLAAEREQGITIDVAYRFFATAHRTFIVADTPGHTQYTRNMATGASTADLAILLVDARKGVLTQTRRHSYIVHTLGIRHVVLAVNKMDLLGWDRAVFDSIAKAYRAFAADLAIPKVMCIPVSALAGDNIANRSQAMSWYTGPTLLQHLETVDVAGDRGTGPFRMPVQWVNRPDADFRGFAGSVVGGSVSQGDPIAVLPSGRTSQVARIVTADGDRESATIGDAVTLVLADDVDVSRGDMICDANTRPEVTDQFAAHIVWMDEHRLLPGRPYWLQTGTALVGAQITEIKHRINVDTLEKLAAKHLDLNDIAVCNVSLDRPLPMERYADNRDTGSFILIDRMTNATIGAGMVDFSLRRASNIHWQQTKVDKTARARLAGHAPCVLWFTGLSGSGKSTVADLVEQRLHALGMRTMLLDGDNVRHGLNRDLGFTDGDRVENIRRIAEVAKLMVSAGLITLVSFISPFRSERQFARGLLDEGEFLEVFVDAPLSVCEARDPKGLYKKARRGALPNFTGIDSAYEPPLAPDLHLASAEEAASVLAEQVIATLRHRGII